MIKINITLGIVNISHVLSEVPNLGLAQVLGVYTGSGLGRSAAVLQLEWPSGVDSWAQELETWTVLGLSLDEVYTQVSRS